MRHLLRNRLTLGALIVGSVSAIAGGVLAQHTSPRDAHVAPPRLSSRRPPTFTGNPSTATLESLSDAFATISAQVRPSVVYISARETVANGADRRRPSGELPPQKPAPIAIEEIPDFYPPTGAKAVMADGDNHVWIRQGLPALQAGADAIWEVIDRNGQVADRVRVPDGATIAGFAPGGFVYLIVRDAGAPTLQKVRVR